MDRGYDRVACALIRDMEDARVILFSPFRLPDRVQCSGSIQSWLKFWYEYDAVNRCYASCPEVDAVCVVDAFCDPREVYAAPADDGWGAVANYWYSWDPYKDVEERLRASLDKPLPVLVSRRTGALLAALVEGVHRDFLPLVIRRKIMAGTVLRVMDFAHFGKRYRLATPRMRKGIKDRFLNQPEDLLYHGGRLWGMLKPHPQADPRLRFAFSYITRMLLFGYVEPENVVLNQVLIELLEGPVSPTEIVSLL